MEIAGMTSWMRRIGKHVWIAAASVVCTIGVGALGCASSTEGVYVDDYSDVPPYTTPAILHPDGDAAGDETPNAESDGVSQGRGTSP